jgi:hypothetical protein
VEGAGHRNGGTRPRTTVPGTAASVGHRMAADLDPLICDLLEWIGPGTRPYGEVMDAWRTSCPRPPVWEEADGRGLLVRSVEPGTGRAVSGSPEVRAFLRRHRRRPADGSVPTQVTPGGR